MRTPFLIYAVFCALVIGSLLAMPVSPAGHVKISDVSFSPGSAGSLVASGTLTGLGASDILVVVEGSGIPLVTCTNPGRYPVSGQNPPRLSLVGSQSLTGGDPIRKNGISPFLVEIGSPFLIPTGSAGGCPSDQWTAIATFVNWTDASILVKEMQTGSVLIRKDFACTTTREAVSCIPV